MKTMNRWGIAVAGVFLQIALGAVYAWSVFRVPLAKQFGWSISEIPGPFTPTILVWGLAPSLEGCGFTAKGRRSFPWPGARSSGGGVFGAGSAGPRRW